MTSASNSKQRPSRKRDVDRIRGNWVYFKVIIKGMKRREPFSYVYHVIFILRRFIFILGALYLFDQAWLQAILYWLSSMLAIGLLLAVKPFTSPTTNIIESISECVILFIGYHVIILTGFSVKPRARN